MRIGDLIPRHIAGQITALMLVAVVLFNGAMTASFVALHWMLRPSGVEVAGSAPRSRQPPPWFAAPPAAGSEADRLPFPPPPELPGGPHNGPSPPFGAGPLLATILFLTISLGVLGIWATRALIAPLQTFVAAAQRFSADGAGTIPEDAGPAEIRALAHALNAMQTRISGLVAERTRMLAAVSHDLRTPITRLRLRAEFLPDEDERRRMLADLDHMEVLVQGALMHLSEGRSRAESIAADLPSLLQSVADQFYDLGKEVTYRGPERLVAMVRPHDIQRAVTNLVENAVNYGDQPSISVGRLPGGELEIRVEDNGPGIAEDRIAAMLEPFTRGDQARGMNASEGFGLGLSIARSIAEAHGGRLVLGNRTPHGLVASILLPASVLVGEDATNVMLPVSTDADTGGKTQAGNVTRA